VRAPITSILILHRPLLPFLVAERYIKHGSSRPVSMGELSLQPLDVNGKSWTD
jgi:hypothetical protein